MSDEKLCRTPPSTLNRGTRPHHPRNLETDKSDCETFSSSGPLPKSHEIVTQPYPISTPTPVTSRGRRWKSALLHHSLFNLDPGIIPAILGQFGFDNTFPDGVSRGHIINVVGNKLGGKVRSKPSENMGDSTSQRHFLPRKILLRSWRSMRRWKQREPNRE
jgi:hypothetical protein